MFIYDFAANLFRKLCTKLHQNPLSFMEDITKNILVSFFLDTVYMHSYSCPCWHWHPSLKSCLLLALFIPPPQL